MKKLLRVLTLAFFLTQANFASKIDFTTLQNPFYKELKSSKKLKLFTIINQKAKINGVWLEAGMSIQGYLLVKVFRQKVLLSKDGKSLELSLYKTRSKISFD